jgi:predicted DNA-binding transcriptional regulator AlpA
MPVRDQYHRSLRMYTEEEVSEMLQVSLSQLRKWRMKQNQGKAQGPPFRKIGRLVRYPEEALMEYVNRR